MLIKINCSLLNFMLDALVLFRVLYFYVYLCWMLYFCLGCWMLYFCGRMLYYAFQFSILGSHVDQSPLHIFIFYLSFEGCFIQ